MIVREEIENASERLDSATRAGDANAIEALKNQGINFVLPSSANELERWHRISAEAIQRLRESNRYSASFLDEMIEHVEAYRAQQRADSAQVLGARTDPSTPGAEAQ